MSKVFQFILLSCLVLSSCVSKKAFDQEKEDLRIEELNFPDDWTGRWQGNLKVHSTQGLQDELRMELIIEPIANSENFSYTIVYDDGSNISKRNYEILVVDKERGLFLVDEKNTIMIESYFIGGKWFQRFEVADNMLVCTIEQQGKNLVWEITSGKNEKISTTGDTNLEGIFEVNTFPYSVYQRAVLTKF